MEEQRIKKLKEERIKQWKRILDKSLEESRLDKCSNCSKPNVKVNSFLALRQLIDSDSKQYQYFTFCDSC